MLFYEENIVIWSLIIKSCDLLRVSTSNCSLIRMSSSGWNKTFLFLSVLRFSAWKATIKPNRETKTISMKFASLQPINQQRHKSTSTSNTTCYQSEATACVSIPTHQEAPIISVASSFRCVRLYRMLQGCLTVSVCTPETNMTEIMIKYDIVGMLKQLYEVKISRKSLTISKLDFLTKIYLFGTIIRHFITFLKKRNLRISLLIKRISMHMFVHTLTNQFLLFFLIRYFKYFIESCVFIALN